MKISPKVQVLLISILVALVNLRIGQTIMGFDNSSPFFSAQATLSRIFGTDNFFHYGGMLFSPGFLLSLLPLPAWLVSFLTYFLAMVVGIFFTSLLIQSQIDQKTQGWIWIVVLVLFGNLLPIWFFSLPILIFAPSFAGIPTVLYLLSKGKDRPNDVLLSVLAMVGVLYFYSTCINIVAFAIYFAETILLAYIIRYHRITIINILKRAFVLGGIWLLIVQGILLLKTPPRFVVTEAINYGIALSQDNKSLDVTNSLFQMESQRNSFVNVARFATGWVSLTDGEGNYIFSYKQLLDSWVGVIATIIPVLAMVYYAISRWKDLKKEEKRLLLLWIIAITLASSYVLPFLRLIPFLGTTLRWISSKLWPIIFIPFVILLSKALTSPKVHSYAKVTTYVCLGVVSSIWLLGIVNKHQQVSMPAEYETIFRPFSRQETVLYLPEPQRLYMRQYKWGYYGSGFLTYLTPAKILDNGSFHPEQNMYPSLVTAFRTCNLKLLKDTGISRIVIDNSTVSGDIQIPACYDSFVTGKGAILTVISL